MFLLEYKTLTHIYFKMYSEKSHSENYWWRSHNIFFLTKTCQWACSFSPSEFSSDQNVGLGIRKSSFCCSQWISHWASPCCAQSWVGNNKILSFMYDKNWSTKNTNGCLRAQWMKSGNAGHCWAQGSSTLCSLLHENRAKPNSTCTPAT